MSRNVRDYGETHNLTQLTQGVLECDEFTAWELAAIALKINGGLGIYRPEKDNLLMFMVIQEVVSEEKAEALADKYISCVKHGGGRTAFVCQHLFSGRKVGFEEAFDTWEDMELEEDEDLQAWCDACEHIRVKHNGWNDDSMAFADIKLVCEKCYFEFKAINS